jgi:hypothetical protein
MLSLMQRITRRLLEQTLPQIISRPSLAHLNEQLALLALRGLGVGNFGGQDERRFLRRFKEGAGPVPTIIDVGANVGHYSEYLLTLMPQARIDRHRAASGKFPQTVRPAEQQGRVAKHSDWLYSRPDDIV